MTGCQHATVALPDSLPEFLRAALALRIDPAHGLTLPVVRQRLAWAVQAAHRLNRDLNYTWTKDAACAMIRRHPDLGTMLLDPCISAAMSFQDLMPEPTEMGLAERVAVIAGGQLAWSDADAWAVWDGRRWRVDPSGALPVEQVKGVVRGLVATEARDAKYIADSYSDDDKSPEKRAAVADAKRFTAFYGSAQTARTIRAALELLRSEPDVRTDADDWDANPRLLNVANGTLELHPAGKAELREHRRDDRITRITRAGFDRAADRTEWETFIAAVLPDPDVRLRVQKVLGYTLLGGNPARLLVLLIGPTSSGKSTLLECIVHALGEYAGPFELSLFRGNREGSGHRADLLAALPRRVIATSEASDAWAIHADSVKRLTGADTIAPRGAYARTAVEARPQFVPIIATNAAPTVIGADDAVVRRLEPLPMTATVAKEDEDADLGPRLREHHADAILAWLVEGWEFYARDGLGPAPAACTVALARVKASLSLIDTWLDARTESDPDAIARPEDVAEDWQRWCDAMHVRDGDRLHSVALARALDARGYRLGTRPAADGARNAAGKLRRERVRLGLRLLPLDEHGEARGHGEGTA